MQNSSKSSPISDYHGNSGEPSPLLLPESASKPPMPIAVQVQVAKNLLDSLNEVFSPVGSAPNPVDSDSEDSEWNFDTTDDEQPGEDAEAGAEELAQSRKAAAKRAKNKAKRASKRAKRAAAARSQPPLLPRAPWADSVVDLTGDLSISEQMAAMEARLRQHYAEMLETSERRTIARLNVLVTDINGLKKATNAAANLFEGVHQDLDKSKKVFLSIRDEINRLGNKMAEVCRDINRIDEGCDELSERISALE